MLEKAAANLPATPTSEAILQGLWGFRDETLGGLAVPLTFTRDTTAPPVACWFSQVLKNRAWVNTDGFKHRCPKEPLPDYG